MEPTIVTETPQNRHILLKIIIGVVLLAIVTGATYLIIQAVHHNNLVNEVKTELIKQNKLIKASAKNKVYSTEIPVGVKTTDKVIISTEISASGTDYCIAGTNKQDVKIVFHMSSTTPESTPVEGDCDQNVTVVPLTPTGFVLGSVGAGAISLQWDKAPFAANYTVQCAADKDFINGLISKITADTSITLSNLVGNTQYYCRVAATNNVGQSIWSPIVLALTDGISVAPKNVMFKTVSSTDLHYSWDPVVGAQYYIVEYSQDDSFVKGVVTLTTTNTSGDATGLDVYTAYYVHVKAITPQFDADHAAFSDEILGRTSK